ncbi:mechanosensitive ion channel family protein [Egbenema bharatensis]|uniref:mechanosensitive ion channel family protein n=1 Tax=Egbenema bharatensis TaxID=3463334 RepID=UPI003A870FF6
MREQQTNAGLMRLARLLRAIGLVVVISAILSGLVLLTPAIAQSASRAAVVVDGNAIFQVSDSGGYEASDRADDINNLLQQVVASGEVPEIQVQADNPNLPTILINGRHLLTVTDGDLVPGRTKVSQARRWASDLDAAFLQAQQERSLPYLRWAAVQAAGALAIAIVLHWALGRFWRRRLGPEIRAVTQIPDPDSNLTQNAPNSVELLLNLLLAIARIAVWLGATLYITNLFPWSRQWSYRFIDILIGSFISPLFTLGENRYSVIDLLILAGMLMALEIATKTVTNVLKTRVLRVTVANRGAREVIALVIRYGLLFIGALVLLQIWGIDLSSLALLASALGIGIGLGLQDIARDIGSGVVLLFERPIQVGDFVQVGSFEGTIERINARSTLVRTLDHISIIVPNSRFLSDEVINWSHGNPVSRLRVPVGIAYGSNIEDARSALLDAAQEHSRILSAPKPMVIFRGFGDHSLNLELFVWTAEPSKHILIKSELYFSIEAKFRKYQVQVPFPQRDLHVRTGSLPIELSPEVEQTLQQLLRMSQNRNGK